jgi:dipeptidyl aminopeptidase/acylaminoacyl peptidase
MHHTRFLLAFLLLMIAAPLRAQTPDAGGDLPPLIDRAKFFGDPQYSSAQIAPDGEHVSFHKSYEGEMNVWVKETGAPFEDARPITADTTRPIPAHFWTQDGDEILFTQDKGGNENYHVYAVDPSAEAEPQTGVPPARDLTSYEDTRASIISVPEETPGEIIVGMNDRNPQVFDPYRVNIETGERELILKNDQNVAGWQADLDGDLRLATKQTESGGTEIYQVNEKGLGEVVYSCSFEESCSPVRFHQDGERVYMTTNKGEPDLSRLVLFNPDTQETEVVESDPQNEVDFGGAEFSDKTDELVATYYRGDRLRYYPKTEQFEDDLGTLREQLPDGEITFGSSTEDESRQIVRVSSDVDPGSAYLYDREAGEAELLYRTRPDLPSEHLAEMQAIRYEARDGTEIPAYLTLPKGVDHENLPVVVNPHGGPWSRDTWGYDGYAQFLANRGYGVLQTNFRGSTGYGQEFLNAGNEEWGDLMQDDITDGVRYLVDEGIADEERIGIFGGSYGGYATLAGLAFTPDVYAAGISYVGPSNIITLLNAIPPYWGPAKERILLRRVGDPEEDRERLRRQSPLFSADQIEAPLMVIQGANDPRVKKQESDQIVVALRERGYPVEYLVGENEGHGFRSRENRLAVAAAMERFLAEHLGGRAQEQMSADLRATLANLTVDPATVTLPDSLDRARAEQAKTAPLPEMDGGVIEPATMQYQSTIKIRGREVTVDKERTIKKATSEGEPVWRVVDVSKSQMGSATDTFDLDRATLRPLRRGTGGQGTIQLRYGEDAVTGEISSRGGQDVAIDTQLDAPVLAGGAGLAVSMAGLPLEPGYETTLRLFNLQKQVVQSMQLTVKGTAKTETAGGSVETYEVEMTPMGGSGSGGGTFYVQREAPHHVVRSEQELPARAGGGTVTTELTGGQ